MPEPGAFLSCDWGTSSFRLRLVTYPGLRIVDEVRTQDGAKSVHTSLVERGLGSNAAARQDSFSTILGRAVAAIQDRNPGVADGIPVAISGMASSTVGWRELPYAKVPLSLSGSGLLSADLEPLRLRENEHRIRLISGVCTSRDVMRGEESEIVGLLESPRLASLATESFVVLPGTHSKHVRVRDHEMVEFRTHMSGELLELLSTRSLLAASVVWPPPAPAAESESAAANEEFIRGVECARKQGLSGSLFQVRARSLLHRVTTADNASFLGGIVIGAELADLVADAGTSPILLAEGPAFRGVYSMALQCLGVGNQVVVASREELQMAVVRTHAGVLFGELTP